MERVIGANSQERAYTAPFFAFVALFALGPLVKGIFEGQAAWPVAHAELWLYPLQTVAAGWLIWHFRAFYQDLAIRRLGFAVAIGLLALAVWIVPAHVLHLPARTNGFDPEILGPGWPYWVNLTLRLMRAVIIVPILEELFWRGFLMRYLIDAEFTQVRLGAYKPFAFWAVVAGFCLEHQMPDWPGAFVTGILYNWVAIRTGSLGSCILAHAITNAALSAYILATHQWGYW